MDGALTKLPTLLMEHLEERHMGRIFVYPLALSSLLTVSYTASAVLTEDIATDDLIDRLHAIAE
jgi:hypothetical protein